MTAPFVTGCQPFRLRSFSLLLISASAASARGAPITAGEINGYGPENRFVSHSMSDSLRRSEYAAQELNASDIARLNAEGRTNG